ncbi:MAG: DUF554 domain-containing protein [Lachnospiraceae bacterium]|jgi:uncharacterized membrane protein YqgA involved in biofilm formation|nr:DUF554 domain-containing protein [Lachnospiraceae bacterium]
MLGTIVNAIAIIVGAGVGILFKKGLPPQMSDTLMKGLGLCTLFLGITGSLGGKNTLLLILSVVIGIIIGEAIDLDARLNRLGQKLENRFGKNKSATTRVSLAEGFVSASLLFCVGALAIIGSLESGLTGQHGILFNKSMIDFVAAAIFASTLGVGVMLSAGSIIIYQGAITLLSKWVAPMLTDIVIAEMTCVGSVILIGLAFNMMGITKLRIMNYVPAIFMPLLLYPLMTWLGIV